MRKRKKFNRKILNTNSLLHEETSARYDNVFFKPNYQFCESAVALVKRRTSNVVK